MTECKTLFDVKEVYYNTKDFDDYLEDIGTSFQQVLVHKEGLTLETIGEVAEYTTLNGTRYVDSERIPLRITGSLKFTKNVDTALLVNHSELVKAGLGNIVGTTTGNTTVTEGKGSSEIPFLTTSTTNLSLGGLVFIPNVGFRQVKSIVSNTSFVVDVPLNTTIGTSTTFVSYKGVDITAPVGNCSKTFNFVVKLHDGSYVKMMGCAPKVEFTPTYEKQAVITFNIICPEIIMLSSAPTGLSSATLETKGTPVKVNFSSSLITDDDAEMYSYFPVNFELGLTISEEPISTIGGRNNIVGYMMRSSLKPKITLDRIAKCKSWVSNYRTARVYSFYKSDFGIYIARGYLTNINQSVANGNHDTIQAELDVNTEADYKVFIVLP